MALYHRATITPTKAEAIAGWAPSQPWCPAADGPLEVIGAFRFDDPEGAVGMEDFLVRAGDVVLHVPLTYRDAPLTEATDALITTMEHSALGQRWVYDGLRDPLFVRMLAAVTMTGQGEALGMVEFEDRWYIAPTNVRIHGGGWSLERVAVDGFTTDDATAADVVLSNDRFELTVHRRPVAVARPPIALTATWEAQAEPVLLASVSELAR